jgi:hypothetical protein
LKDDTCGRGINQQTGELVIRRRLDATDRNYQSLVNRALLGHQGNVATAAVDSAAVHQLTTERTIGSDANIPDVVSGGLLLDNKRLNAWEILTLPAPRFYTAKYTLHFWTQYTSHMNQMIERLMSAILPQGNALRLDTAKGYWFVAKLGGMTFNSESNIDDMTNTERIIKHKFEIAVPAYVLASDAPGNPIPLRRYVSAADVQFVGALESSEAGDVDDPYLGADDPTLPIDRRKSLRSDQRFVGKNRGLAASSTLSKEDPALAGFKRGVNPPRYKQYTTTDPRSGKLIKRNVKVQTINATTGESSYSSVSNIDELVVALAEDD